MHLATRDASSAVSPMGNWHDTLGEAMIVTGLVGILMTSIGALRRDRAQP